MSRVRLIAAIVILAIAFLVMIRIQEMRLRLERRRTTKFALRLSNLEAERDSTKDVALASARVAALVGDSLRIVSKKVVQAEQRATELDRALGAERIASYQLRANVASLQSSGTAVTNLAQAGDSRVADFVVRQAPYMVVARIRMPPPPAAATLDLRVSLDPIDLTARIRCSQESGHGVPTATIDVAGPRWANVRLGHLEQSPDVCREPTPLDVARGGRLRLTPWFGIGRVLSGRGKGTWGMMVGVGVAAG